MGILGILRDSAGSLGDSRGFSGFLEKVYEVSEVSNPSSLPTKISCCFYVFSIPKNGRIPFVEP